VIPRRQPDFLKEKEEGETALGLADLKFPSMVRTNYGLEAYASLTPSPRYGGSEVMVFP
jgi:hypothetical protein